MAFNADQAGMAIFLLIAALTNAWFVFTSLQRIAKPQPDVSHPHDTQSNHQTDDDEIVRKTRFRLVNYSVLTMSLFDIPWVWLCMIQCWNNTLTDANALHQTNGDDSFGCRWMGWYSTFSLFAMMGCHNLVAYYTKNYYRVADEGQGGAGTAAVPFLETTRGFLLLAASLLASSSLFASMPLIGGGGYILTNGGFCYADFTDAAQCCIILTVVVAFLVLSTYQWWCVGRREYVVFYVLFFATWALWIPAAIRGIADGEEVGSPYMIIGAVVGHGNAVMNPLLYGVWLYRILSMDDRGHVIVLNKEKMVDP